eukprot:Gb_20337 [translate_table: standard]
MCSTGAFPLYSCGLLPLERQMGHTKVPTFSTQNRKKNKMHPNVVKASSGDSEFGAGGPSIVDANMIVLRKRMNDLNMQERNYEPPEEWMEWEKKVYPAYHSTICHAIGLLQNYLMNTRPSFAIATLSLMSLSVAASGRVIAAASELRRSEKLKRFVSYKQSKVNGRYLPLRRYFPDVFQGQDKSFFQSARQVLRALCVLLEMRPYRGAGIYVCGGVS